MFKIGEFSQISQVSVRMLRHYDKLGLLKPSHIDKWSGYRYYTIDQLPRLNRIVALNGMGLTLQQISDLLREDDSLSVDRLRGMLMLRQSELAREMEEVRMQLISVEARLHQIEREGQPSPYEIVVKEVDELPVASLGITVPHVAQMGYYCATLYEQLYGHLAEMGIEPQTPEITLYHSHEYRETDLEVEMAVAVEGDVVDEEPRHEHVRFRRLPLSPMSATLVFEGPFEQVTDGVLALLAWVGMQGYAPAGSLAELHLSGPAHQECPGDDLPVIELQLPIAPGG